MAKRSMRRLVADADQDWALIAQQLRDERDWARERLLCVLATTGPVRITKDTWAQVLRAGIPRGEEQPNGDFLIWCEFTADT